MIVIFSVGDLKLGIDIDQVIEIMRTIGLAAIPAGKCFVQDTMTFRGYSIPVLSWREKIGMQPVAVDVKSRILVLEEGGRFLGLLVDSVDLIRYLDSNAMAIFSQPDKEGVRQSPSFENRDLPDQLVTLVDVDRIDFEIKPNIFSDIKR